MSFGWWLQRGQWQCQPIWYGHHESNLVSNLFINIRDANKSKGKGHGVNNTAAYAFTVLLRIPWKLGWKVAWGIESKYKKMKDGNNARNMCLNFDYSGSFSPRLVLASSYSTATQFLVSVTCQVNQFQTYFLLTSDNGSQPSVLTQPLQLDPFFSQPQYSFSAENDWS